MYIENSRTGSSAEYLTNALFDSAGQQLTADAANANAPIRRHDTLRPFFLGISIAISVVFNERKWARMKTYA
jgi:hypothetical protein